MTFRGLRKDEFLFNKLNFKKILKTKKPKRIKAKQYALKMYKYDKSKTYTKYVK